MKPTVTLITFIALRLAPTAALHAADMRPSLSVPIIGKGVRQIFADDVLIASKSGVERKVHAAAKLERPVLEASAPWEIGATVKGQADRRLYIYGTVFTRRRERPFSHVVFGGRRRACTSPTAEDTWTTTPRSSTRCPPAPATSCTRAS